MQRMNRSMSYTVVINKIPRHHTRNQRTLRSTPRTRAHNSISFHLRFPKVPNLDKLRSFQSSSHMFCVVRSASQPSQPIFCCVPHLSAWSSTLYEGKLSVCMSRFKTSSEVGTEFHRTVFRSEELETSASESAFDSSTVRLSESSSRI